MGWHQISPSPVVLTGRWGAKGAVAAAFMKIFVRNDDSRALFWGLQGFSVLTWKMSKPPAQGSIHLDREQRWPASGGDSGHLSGTGNAQLTRLGISRCLWGDQKKAPETPLETPSGSDWDWRVCVNRWVREQGNQFMKVNTISPQSITDEA